LGWKLASVLRGGAHVKLLESYHNERHQIAVDVQTQTSKTFNFLLGKEGKP
ncbi:fad-binding monooxygenase, partial [Cystoisospora suis]